MLRVTFRTLASASTKARYAFYTVCLVNSVLVGVWAIMDLAISGNPSTSKIGELYHCVALAVLMFLFFSWYGKHGRGHCLLKRDLHDRLVSGIFPMSLTEFVLNSQQTHFQ